MSTYFITGISTDVGKTVVSAIITEALQADYWKPIQAGDLENSDTHKVKKYISNDITQYHDNAFQLKTPMSPHAAAAIDKVEIAATDIMRPQTENDLVIEGAGGLLVPINDTETIADLIQKDDKVIVVSRHYLGSINHTLMTIELDEHPTTESIITQMTGVNVIGRIDEEPYFDQNVIREYADRFYQQLRLL